MNGYAVLTQRGGYLDDSNFQITADSAVEAVEVLEYFGYEVIDFSEDRHTVTVAP